MDHMLNFPKLRLFMLAGGFCFLAGCGASPPNSDPANAAAVGDSSYFVPDEIAFLDSVESNALSTGGLENLAFVDVDGNTVTMKDLLGKNIDDLIKNDPKEMRRRKITRRKNYPKKK